MTAQANREVYTVYDITPRLKYKTVRIVLTKFPFQLKIVGKYWYVLHVDITDIAHIYRKILTSTYIGYQFMVFIPY